MVEFVYCRATIRKLFAAGGDIKINHKRGPSFFTNVNVCCNMLAWTRSYYFNAPIPKPLLRLKKCEPLTELPVKVEINIRTQVRRSGAIHLIRSVE